MDELPIRTCRQRVSILLSRLAQSGQIPSLSSSSLLVRAHREDYSLLSSYARRDRGIHVCTAVGVEGDTLATYDPLEISSTLRVPRQPDEDGYLPWKWGGRFSRKARMPSP